MPDIPTIFGLPAEKGRWGLVALGLLINLCLGGWLAIAPTATASYFGTCDYPRCYGVVFLAYGAGAIAGPQLAGFVRTTTGTYLGVFPLVAALAAVGFAAAWLLMRPPESVPVVGEKEEGVRSSP